MKKCYLVVCEGLEFCQVDDYLSLHTLKITKQAGSQGRLRGSPVIGRHLECKSCGQNPAGCRFQGQVRHVRGEKSFSIVVSKSGPTAELRACIPLTSVCDVDVDSDGEDRDDGRFYFDSLPHSVLELFSTLVSIDNVPPQAIIDAIGQHCEKSFQQEVKDCWPPKKFQDGPNGSVKLARAITNFRSTLHKRQARSDGTEDTCYEAGFDMYIQVIDRRIHYLSFGAMEIVFIFSYVAHSMPSFTVSSGQQGHI